MMTMTDDRAAVVQLDSGGGVGVGVSVTVVCSTESRDADRLPMRSRVTASLSGSALLAVSAVAVPAAAAAFIIPAAVAAAPPPRFPVLDVAVVAATIPPADPSALLPAHCTAPPRPTVTDSHFCLPLFFFLRLKKQQHLEMKQTLIGLRVVPLWQRLFVKSTHRACMDPTTRGVDGERNLSVFHSIRLSINVNCHDIPGGEGGRQNNVNT